MLQNRFSDSYTGVLLNQLTRFFFKLFSHNLLVGKKQLYLVETSRFEIFKQFYARSANICKNYQEQVYCNGILIRTDMEFDAGFNAVVKNAMFYLKEKIGKECNILMILDLNAILQFQ